MVWESLNEYLWSNSKIKQQANLILEEDDEKEILSILANKEFISNNDFKNKFNLWKYHMNEKEIQILKVDNRGDIYK